jgi:hypothetical protein
MTTAEAIREVVHEARAMRAREDALRAAVASGDAAAILQAARELFEEDDDERDRAPARLDRGAGRS